jgi:hypothetical protein
MLLPEDAGAFDELHRGWRNTLQVTSIDGMSHGVAAKLINTYLKAAVLCTVLTDCTEEPLRKRVSHLHPPLDSLLFQGIAEEVARADRAKWRSLRWSTFTSKQYEDTIGEIRSLLGGQIDGALVELWRIERRWPGHRGGGATLTYEETPLLEMGPDGRPFPGEDFIVRIPVCTDEADPPEAVASLIEVGSGRHMASLAMVKLKASLNGRLAYVIKDPDMRYRPQTRLEGTINQFVNERITSGLGPPAE